MNGTSLTLGLLGGLAIAGATAGSRGTQNRKSRRPGKTDRFRRVAVPAGFTTSPYPFVRGYVLQQIVDPNDHGRAAPGIGLFHVTTNLPAVLADRDATHPLGRLRSRRELRGIGRQSAGLGGGRRDVMPDRVSVGLTFDGAQRVLRGIMMMARAVHGQIEPNAAMDELLDLTASTLDTLQSAVDWMNDDEDEDSKIVAAARAFEREIATDERHVRRAWVDAERPRKHAWESPVDKGHFLYDRLVEYENTLANTSVEWIENGWISDDEITCTAPVGFTEPAIRFQHVRPENVGLLQLAGRRGIGVEHVNNECELRFRPEDLRVVGVWEPA